MIFSSFLEYLSLFHPVYGWQTRIGFRNQYTYDNGITIEHAYKFDIEKQVQSILHDVLSIYRTCILERLPNIQWTFHETRHFFPPTSNSSFRQRNPKMCVFPERLIVFRKLGRC